MSAVAQAQHLCNVCSVLARLLWVLLWQGLTDFKPVRESSLKGWLSTDQRGKDIPTRGNLTELLEKGSEMMRDLQGETSGMPFEKSQRTCGAGLRIGQMVYLPVSWAPTAQVWVCLHTGWSSTDLWLTPNHAPSILSLEGL